MRGEAYVLLFLCGLGDALTTFTALCSSRIVGYEYTSYALADGSMGVIGQPIVWSAFEVNCFFIPFLATLIFCVAVWFISWLPAPETAKNPIISFLVVVAFSATANNLAVLLGVQTFSLV